MYRSALKGIIPARAGFTPSGRPTRTPPSDHPRSRGVYTGVRSGPLPCGGSSPLARGLHPSCPRRHRGVGIIPARAGFTPRRRRDGRGGEDHPRSRGVYMNDRLRWQGHLGSSPLARGLPRVEGDADGGGRIIPARAGFTRRSGSTPPWRTDHPRSRGVYDLKTSNSIHGSGSSPLARGLRTGPGARAAWAGIIPARAGFTRQGAVGHGQARDHPRSRGVYMEPWRGTSVQVGSSPLARGLPTPPRPWRTSPRIIPARAGFTRAWAWAYA